MVFKTLFLIKFLKQIDKDKLLKMILIHCWFLQGEGIDLQIIIYSSFKLCIF